MTTRERRGWWAGETMAASALVAALIGGFAYVGWGIWRAAHDEDARSGVSYSALQERLDDLLSETAEPRLTNLIRVDVAQLMLPTRAEALSVSACFDTLAIVGDSLEYPSLARGGFLRDQVELYNRDQLAALERATEQALTDSASAGAIIDLCHRSSRSVLRTAAGDEDGTRPPTLAGKVNVSSMRVPSPFDERAIITLVSRNSRHGFAFSTKLGVAPVSDGSEVPGTTCAFRFRNAGDQRVGFQCVAAGGPFDQLNLDRLDVNLPQAGTISLAMPGLQVSLDGERLNATARGPVFPSSLLQVGAPDAPASRHGQPAILIQRVAGEPLGGSRWLNGSIQWGVGQSSSPFMRIVSSPNGLGTVRGLPDAADVIALSLDRELTDRLQGSLERFYRTHDLNDALAYAVVVLADVRTGEILAVAEAADTPASEGSYALRAVNVGSAIKPIYFSAVLNREPSLGSLIIKSPTGLSVSELWDYPLGREFDTGEGCKGLGAVDLRSALKCSSNLYALSMLALALGDERDGRAPFARATRNRTPEFQLDGIDHAGEMPDLRLLPGNALDDKLLARSTLAYGLAEFDSISTSVAVAGLLGPAGRDADIWSGLHLSRSPQPVRVPLSLAPERSRLALVARQDERVGLRSFAAYAIGTGESRINLFDLVENYARIASDRRVHLTMAYGLRRDTANVIGMRSHAWYSTMLRGLDDVGRPGGTAGKAEESARATLEGVVGPTFQLYSKTGTVDYPSSGTFAQVVARTKAPPVRLKTYAFVVGRAEDGEGSPLRCGVAGVVYLRFKSNPVPVQVDFANTQIWPLLRDRWRAMGICGGYQPGP